MDSNSYKTKYLNKESIQKNWFVVNADGKTLGRFSSEVAKILRGKNKASFTPHMDCGDYVVIINSDGIKMTGKKWREKQYVSHSGYPGGQKIINPLDLKEKKSSTFIIEKAVRGMLPKNRLGRSIIKKLHIYSSDTHPHVAQNPVELNFEIKKVIE